MKVYRVHPCERRHRTVRTLVACMIPRAVWIVGTGQYALISSCQAPTVSLHNDVDSAKAALGFIDTYGCGHRCTRRHEIVRIDLDGQETMFRGSAPLPTCTCGHVRRIHGGRPGFDLPDDRCRACDCPRFEATP